MPFWQESQICGYYVWWDCIHHFDSLIGIGYATSPMVKTAPDAADHPDGGTPFFSQVWIATNVVSCSPKEWVYYSLLLRTTKNL